MKLKRLKLLKKITDITIVTLPKDEAANDVPAFLFRNNRDVLCINPNVKWGDCPDNEEWWTVIITHEELHRVLAEIECDRLDNVFPTIRKSIFLAYPERI